MKKIIPLLLFVFIAMISCSTDDESTVFYEILETIDVSSVPETLKVGRSDTLQVSYERPSTCHGLQGFDVTREGDTRNIAVVGVVFEDGEASCADLADDVRTTPIVFRPEAPGNLTLNFFSGRDENGEPEFITITLDVEE